MFLMNNDPKKLVTYNIFKKILKKTCCITYKMQTVPQSFATKIIENQ